MIFRLYAATLGMSIDAPERRVYVSHAALPSFLDQVSVHGLQVGPDASVDLLFDRHAHDVAISVLARTGEVAVIVTK